MDDHVPWVLLGRIPRRVPVGAQHAAAVAAADAHAHAQAAGEEAAAGDEEAELEAGAEHAADFSFPLVAPPRVTVMNAGASADPDPNGPDKYPYVLGVESGILLLNFGVEPFYGACLDDRPYPYQSNLIVAREFEAAVEEGLPLTGAAERIAPRNEEQAVVTNIESVGLLSTTDHDAVDRLLVAELLVNRGSDTSRLVYIFAGDDYWIQKDAPNPLLGHDHDREGDWVPSGVIPHTDMLWWFDLSWGLISFDPAAEVEVPKLLFHALPDGRALNMAQPGIHNSRCIAESDGQLLFVEIITDDPDGDAEAARVCVWSRTSDDNNVTIGWNMERDVGFEEIWNHDSYIATGLPRKVPVLVAMSPLNVDHVYFVLQEEQRLFCADLLTRTVAEFVDEDYDLVTPWPVPPSCRYVLPWFVPVVQVPQALGPFDNLDDGEMEANIEEMQEEEINDNAVLQEDKEQQIIAEAQDLPALSPPATTRELLHEGAQALVVRLRSRVRGTYLYADKDAIGLSLRARRATPNVEWDLRGIQCGGAAHIVLCGRAYGLFVAVSPGPGGVRVIQASYDTPELRCVPWTAVQVASDVSDTIVVLRHVCGGVLSADGTPTGVTLGHMNDQCAMAHWVLEVVDAAPRRAPPPGSGDLARSDVVWAPVLGGGSQGPFWLPLLDSRGAFVCYISGPCGVAFRNGSCEVDAGSAARLPAPRQLLLRGRYVVAVIPPCEAARVPLLVPLRRLDAAQAWAREVAARAKEASSSELDPPAPEESEVPARTPSLYNGELQTRYEALVRKWQDIAGLVEELQDLEEAAREHGRSPDRKKILRTMRSIYIMLKDYDRLAGEAKIVRLYVDQDGEEPVAQPVLLETNPRDTLPPAVRRQISRWDEEE